MRPYAVPGVVVAVPAARGTTPAMQEEAQLRDELASVAEQARERRSVDAFTRAGIEGFVAVVLVGICGKLLWDSARIPLFFWPLGLLDALLFWDAVQSVRTARADLRRELSIEARLRELRSQLGIDP